MSLKIGSIYRHINPSFGIWLYRKIETFETNEDRRRTMVCGVNPGETMLIVDKRVFPEYVSWKCLTANGLGWWHVFGPDDDQEGILEEVTEERCLSSDICTGSASSLETSESTRSP